MIIDWNIAVLKTLKKGKIKDAEKIKGSLQWVENRLCLILQHYHSYCYYTRTKKGDTSDLEDIESELIEIIDSATYVLKETRKLKCERTGKKYIEWGR